MASTETRTVDPAVWPSIDELIALRREVSGRPLQPRVPARSLLAGAHHSRFRGRGMDYLESRIYQPGDDIRTLDWRVTARSGKVHTKVYHEERERPVMLLVDFTPSMFFATRGRFKSAVAARAAAWLGWATARHGDRVGALLFNGDHREVRPRSGDKGVLRLIHELVVGADPRAGLSETPRPGALNEALRRLRRVARPGSLVVLLSDFHGADDQTGQLVGHLRRHNEMLAVRIVDVLEQLPPPPDLYPVTDGKEHGWLDLRDPARQAEYRALFEQRHRRVAELLKAQAVPLVEMSTTDEPAELLGRWLSGMARRGR